MLLQVFKSQMVHHLELGLKDPATGPVDCGTAGSVSANIAYTNFSDTDGQVTAGITSSAATVNNGTETIGTTQGTTITGAGSTTGILSFLEETTTRITIALVDAGANKDGAAVTAWVTAANGATAPTTWIYGSN